MTTLIVSKDRSGQFSTIQEAANVAVAGDVVYVKAGTYNEYVTVKNSGSAGKYITFAAYPGNTVTLDGKGLSASSVFYGLFEITGQNYITIDGFRLINGYSGIHSDWSNNQIYRNNYIENPYASSILVGYNGLLSNYNILIEKNTINRYASTFWNGNTMMWNEMISVAGGKNIEVRYNYIMQNSIGEGIDYKVGVIDSTIHHNTVKNTDSAGVYIDGYTKPTGNIQIYNNLVSGQGIFMGSEEGTLTQGVKIFNNVVYNGVSGIGFVVWTSGTAVGPAIFANIEFYDNYVYGNTYNFNQMQLASVNRNNVVALPSDMSQYGAGAISPPPTCNPASLNMTL